MTTDELLTFISECRALGVSSFKGDLGGHVEFTLYPSFGKADDVFAELSKPVDPNKCQRCQAAPLDGRIRGMCRACSIAEAGVSS